jgi:hypothetical protein
MPQPQTDWMPIRFIAEEIKVQYKVPPMVEKKPDAPSGFTWGEEPFTVVEVIKRWFSYERKGRFAKNMQPHHLRTAKRRGSWGVGRFYFRVRTEGGRVFDIYYDRASEEAGDRKGHWYLWREMEPVLKEK